MTAPQWAKYTTGKWHAFTGRCRNGRPVSECGLTTLRQQTETSAAPGGDTCRLCVERLVDRRRGRRRTLVDDYLNDIRRVITERVPPAVLSWSGAPDFVTAAEAELASELLSWELTGAGPLENIHDAERALLCAWDAAADAWVGRGRPRR